MYLQEKKWGKPGGESQVCCLETQFSPPPDCSPRFPVPRVGLLPQRPVGRAGALGHDGGTVRVQSPVCVPEPSFLMSTRLPAPSSMQELGEIVAPGLDLDSPARALASLELQFLGV